MQKQNDSDSDINIDTDNSIILMKDWFSDHLSQQLNNFRHSQDFVDFKIHAGGKSFDCHRNVIAAFSSVLGDMARAPMKEGINCEATLDSIESNIMTLIMDFMYKDAIIFKKTEIQGLLTACDYLNISKLKDRLLPYVPSLLTPDNAVGWLSFSKLLHLDNTAALVQQFIVNTFRQVAQNHEFLTLSAEELKDFLKEVHLLSDDLLFGVFAWIDEDKEARVGLINIATDIQVNLYGCSVEFLRKITDRYPDVSMNCLLYEQIADMHVTTAAETSVNLPITVVGRHTNEYDMWKLNTNKQFEPLQISGLHCISSQGSVPYSVCQYDTRGFFLTELNTKNVYVYEYARKAWSVRCSLPSGMFAHVSVYVEQVLFVMCDRCVVGGKKKASVTYCTTIDEFGFNRDWQQAPGAPIEKLAIAHVGPDAYVIGEGNPNLYQFDTRDKAWIQRAALPHNPGAEYSMTRGSDKIYAAGGTNNICCVYEPGTDTWTDICRPLRIHRHGALVFHDNKLVLLGGESSELEKYDIGKNIWIMMPYKLPKSLSRPFAFMMDQ